MELNYLEITSEKILLCGDIHGNWSYFKFIIEKDKINDCTIILLGDVGLGFTSEETQLSIIHDIYKNILKERNIKLYCFRGNHDNPSYFIKDKYDFTKHNFHIIPDYSIVKTYKGNLFVLGGALSIDRKTRSENDMYSKNKSYWKEEEVIFDFDLLKEVKDVNIVLTHTAPLSFYPNFYNNLVLSFAKYDSNLIHDLTNERENMDKVYNILKENNEIYNWYYGHFHYSKSEIHDKMIARLLNINEIYEL